jgi:hypothetical protein
VETVAGDCFQKSNLFDICFHFSSLVGVLPVSSIDQSTLAVVARDFKMAASMEAISWVQENEDKVIELWAERLSLFNIESLVYMNRDTKNVNR